MGYSSLFGGYKEEEEVLSTSWFPSPSWQRAELEMDQVKQAIELLTSIENKSEQPPAPAPAPRPAG